MSQIVIPGSAAPSNLHFGDDVQVAMVESDLYDICTRIKEVDPTLFIIQATQDDRCQFIIMEHCSDGVDRIVSKEKHLDARIIEKCERMRAIPFEQRYDAIEAEIEKEEAEQKEQAFDELYENMGRPMLRELEKTGFIQRNVSYPILSKKR